MNKGLMSWRPVAAGVVASLVGSVGFAQECGSGWLAGDGVPGLNAAASASVMWDPDGAGPMAARAVVAGFFGVAGDLNAWGIAMYDPATGAWSAMPDFPVGRPAALAVDGTGALIGAGGFLQPEGIGHSHSHAPAHAHQVKGTLVADWDDNGIVNSTDVSEFINDWFSDTAAGCGG